jgi:hypothetical protein
MLQSKLNIQANFLWNYSHQTSFLGKDGFKTREQGRIVFPFATQ